MCVLQKDEMGLMSWILSCFGKNMQGSDAQSIIDQNRRERERIRDNARKATEEEEQNRRLGHIYIGCCFSLFLRAIRADTYQAITDLAAESGRRQEQREGRSRDVLRELEEGKRTADAMYAEKGDEGRVGRQRRLEGIEEVGQKTRRQQEKEIREVEEDYEKRRKEVEERSKEGKRELDKLAQKEEKRHKERMQLYQTK